MQAPLSFRARCFGGPSSAWEPSNLEPYTCSPNFSALMKKMRFPPDCMLLCQEVGFKTVRLSLFCFNVGVFSISFRRNRPLCKCTFSVSMGGREFRSLLRCHLNPESPIQTFLGFLDKWLERLETESTNKVFLLEGPVYKLNPGPGSVHSVPSS